MPEPSSDFMVVVRLFEGDWDLDVGAVLLLDKEDWGSAESMMCGIGQWMLRSWEWYREELGNSYDM